MWRRKKAPPEVPSWRQALEQEDDETHRPLEPDHRSDHSDRSRSRSQSRSRSPGRSHGQAAADDDDDDDDDDDEDEVDSSLDELLGSDSATDELFN
jgi:hypothetical protein